MMRSSNRLLACCVLFYSFFNFLPSVAEAYLGPGLGLGTVGVVLSAVVANILILLAIVWYPLKRLLKWIRKKKDVNAKNSIERDL